METQFMEGCDTCGTQLHEDMHIHIWERGEEELTICEFCHQDMGAQMHSQGWKHDEE